MFEFPKSLVSEPQREASTLWVMTEDEIAQMSERQKTDRNNDPNARVILFRGARNGILYDSDNEGPPQHLGLNVAGYCNSLEELQKMVGQLEEMPARISISARLRGADIVQIRLLQQCCEKSDRETRVEMHGSMADIARWSGRGAGQAAR